MRLQAKERKTAGGRGYLFVIEKGDLRNDFGENYEPFELKWIPFVEFCENRVLKKKNPQRSTKKTKEVGVED